MFRLLIELIGDPFSLKEKKVSKLSESLDKSTLNGTEYFHLFRSRYEEMREKKTC